MTTPIEIIAGYNTSLAREAFTYMKDLVGKLSYFENTSELAYLNNQAPRDEWVSVSPFMSEFLTLAKELETQSNGDFCIDYEGRLQNPHGKHGFIIDIENDRVKMNSDTKLNPGGLGKGFIVDKTVAFLQIQTGEPILVNAGGDLRVAGTYPWKIGLYHPETQQPFGHTKIRNGAVATSGTYARSKTQNGKSVTHFYDRSSNQYAEKTPYSSVTIIGHQAATAEVYAKLILMGKSIALPKGSRAIGIRTDTKEAIEIPI